LVKKIEAITLPGSGLTCRFFIWWLQEARPRQLGFLERWLAELNRGVSRHVLGAHVLLEFAEELPDGPGGAYLEFLAEEGKLHVLLGIDDVAAIRSSKPAMIWSYVVSISEETRSSEARGLVGDSKGCSLLAATER
jgi:hypothetical protein